MCVGMGCEGFEAEDIMSFVFPGFMGYVCRVIGQVVFVLCSYHGSLL